MEKTSYPQWQNKTKEHLVITLTTNVPNLMEIPTQFIYGHKSLNKWSSWKQRLITVKTRKQNKKNFKNHRVHARTHTHTFFNK